MEQEQVPAGPLVAARLLLWVWYQYGTNDKDPSGRLCLYSGHMSAGEDAGEFLEGLGLVADDGYHCILTAAGLKLMGLESEYKPYDGEANGN